MTTNLPSGDTGSAPSPQATADTTARLAALEYLLDYLGDGIVSTGALRPWDVDNLRAHGHGVAADAAAALLAKYAYLIPSVEEED